MKSDKKTIKFTEMQPSWCLFVIEALGVSRFVPCQRQSCLSNRRHQSCAGPKPIVVCRTQGPSCTSPMPIVVCRTLLNCSINSVRCRSNANRGLPNAGAGLVPAHKKCSTYFFKRDWDIIEGRHKTGPCVRRNTA